METRKLRVVLMGAAALLLIGLALPSRHADIRILAADQSDVNPHRLQAAIDLGVFAVSILVTWTAQVAN